MADSSLLLQALMSGQEKAAENPFGIVAQGLSSGIPAMVNPYASTGSNAGMVVGSSLLAALLAGIAKNQATAANTAFLPVQREFVGATPERQQELLQGQYGRQLSPLATALQLQSMERQNAINLETGKAEALLPIEQRRGANTAANDLLKTQGKVFLDGQIVDVMDPIAQKEEEAAASARGSVIGTNEGYGLDPSENPDSPQAKQAKIIREEEDRAKGLINKLPSVVQFQNMQKALPQLDAYKDLDTKSSDNSFIYAYIKALDDGAVREGEVGLANTANPRLQAIAAKFEAELTGKSALTPALKRQMVQELKASQANVYEQALKDSEIELGVALRRGANEANVLPFAKGLTFDTAPAGGDISADAARAELIRRGVLPGG
jgi:hypothetical protein